MFLNQRENGPRRVFHPGDREQGSALASVLGVMAVGLLFATLITTSVVGALGVSTSIRAGVQSGASADAGIAAARQGLSTGTCSAEHTSTDAPVYSYTVSSLVGGAWVSGCPGATATQVKVRSTGTAQSDGVNGASNGDSTTVEAVFTYVSGGIVPSGVAVYLYRGGVIEANSSLDMTESPGAGVMVKDGDFECKKNNGTINGSLVVNGDLHLDSKCTINGSAWVTGTAYLGSGYIRDTLTAGAVNPSVPGDQVGDFYYSGDPAAPVPPTVPPWTEQGYNPAAWVNSAGDPYEVKDFATSNACTLPKGSLGGTIAGAPVIFDARSCASGPLAANNTTVKLTSDVVIFANRFNFASVNSLNFTSSTSAPHRLWFITPDLVDDSQPSCDLTTQGNFEVMNGFAINDPIDALLYTPCAFDGKNGFEWRGQIISGAVSSIKNNPVFTFSPIGLPGVNLMTGGASPSATTPQLGAVISRREMAG